MLRLGYKAPPHNFCHKNRPKNIFSDPIYPKIMKSASPIFGKFVRFLVIYQDIASILILMMLFDILWISWNQRTSFLNIFSFTEIPKFLNDHFVETCLALVEKPIICAFICTFYIILALPQVSFMNCTFS